tara:strand:- start:196 stop:462 length:267 start_codon:yes stop_codon:yes gene_type:complete
MIQQYKFNEDKILQTIKEHIDSTYNEHYANNKYQATDIIVDSGHGEGFCLGNIIKYAIRYGKKEGKNPQDLLKIIHYAIIALNVNTND